MVQFTSARDRFDAAAVIRALREKGAKLWVENGKLRYRAPNGVITAEDVARLQYVDLRYVGAGDMAGASLYEPYLVPRVHATRLPLAFSQLDHWNLRATTKYRPVRQVASATSLQGRLDETVMNDAFSLVVSRHDALRTRISVADGEPFQETFCAGGSKMHVYDLSSIAIDERAIEVQRHITSAIIDISDYAKDALFQAVLLKLRREESILILALDHIVSDGASLSIILHELLTAHAQGVRGGEMSLPNVRMQFPDYALWQRQVIPELLSNQMLSWKSWRCTEFPRDPVPSDQAGWGIVRLVIDVRMRVALQRLARNLGTSLVMVVLVAFVILISKWCNTSVISVQVMSDGRMSRLVDNTVGYLAFPVYLRIGVAEHDTFYDILEIVTGEYSRASEKPDFYYSCVQSPQPDCVRSATFNWLPRRDEGDDVFGNGARTLIQSAVPFENPFLKTLECNMEPWVLFQDRGKEVLVEVEYSRMRFCRKTMQRFAENLSGVLRALVNKPKICLREIEMS